MAKIDLFLEKYQSNKRVLTSLQEKLKDSTVQEGKYNSWQLVELEPILEYFNTELENKISILEFQESKEVKALYYSAYATSRDSKIDTIIDIAQNTEINALMIDIKETDGKTSFEFDQENFSTIKPVSNKRIKDIEGILKKLKDNDIYTIGRIVVFKDEYLANTRPDLAIKWSWDTWLVWWDYKWNSYTDPWSTEVWDYHVELASAAYNLGFDEINFDYVRFPSDGYIGQTYYPKSTDILEENPKWWKIIVMDRFAEYINRKLDEDVANLVVSADVFWLVTNTNLFQIWQNLESYLLYFDYVAPMIYPSHYWAGYLWQTVPDNAPYEIFFDSMNKSKERIDTLNKKIIASQSGTWELLIEWIFKTSGPKQDFQEVSYDKIRPWLQWFTCSWCPWATKMNANKFRKQIRAIEDLWFTSGWYVWHASANYYKDWYK
jgi:hypothetical protein